MSITASGLFCATLVDLLDATQLAVNTGSDTFRVALFNNSATPNFTTDTAYGVAPYNANEVTGTGWAAGGVALGSITFTAASGTVTFDAANVSEASVTVTAVRGILLYDDTLGGNNAIALINLGADFAVSAGTLAINWAAAGIWAIDATP